jgi:50S ribosomal protein L31
MDTLQKCITDIKQILLQAQQKAYQATAFAMIEGFWRIGRRIVEEEQQGSIRANYGEQVIAQLSKELGKGFSERTLRDYRRFYLLFPDQDNLAHMCAQLT